MKANKQNWLDFIGFLETHKGTLGHAQLTTYAKACKITTNAGTIARKHGIISQDGQYHSSPDPDKLADELIIMSRDYSKRTAPPSIRRTTHRQTGMHV